MLSISLSAKGPGGEEKTPIKKKVRNGQQEGKIEFRGKESNTRKPIYWFKGD